MQLIENFFSSFTDLIRLISSLPRPSEKAVKYQPIEKKCVVQEKHFNHTLLHVNLQQK